MGNDTLEVELILKDEKFDAKITNSKRKLESYGSAADLILKKDLISQKSIQNFNLVEAKAEKLRRTLESVSKVQSGKGFDYLSISADKAASRVGVIQNQLTGIRKLMSETTNKSVLSQLTSEAKLLESELDKVKTKADRLNQRQVRSNPANNFGQDALGGLGIPVGVAAIGALAAGAAIEFGKQSFEAAREGANAQLVLRASAKETGKSFAELTNQAKLFGEQTLQSNRAAVSSFAQIVTFANAAGRSDKLDEFRTKFSDLAAAKGIDPSNLGEIAKQLNALTDEATDKLLNGNPSAFYDKFAKSINKTADSLTDAEKRAAVFDEVLRRGAIFSGSAEQKINSSAAAVDRLSKKFEDFKEKAGQAILPLVEFSEKAINLGGFADIARPAFSSANSNNDFLKKISTEPTLIPISMGLNLADNTTRKISDFIFGNDIDRQVKISVQYAIEVQKTKEAVDFLRASDKEIGDAKANPFGSLKNFALSKVNIASSFFDPAARKKAIEEATADAENFVKDLKQKFENPQHGGNVGLLKLAKKDFQAYSNLFDSETRFKIQQSIASAISEGTAKGFQLALGNPNATLGDLRKNLKQIFASTDLLPDTKSGLINQFESKIKQSVDEAKNKVKELEKQYLATFDALYQKSGSSNPFVAVFAEANKALTDLRKNLAGLSPELQAQAIALQTKINSNALFSASLDNALATFELRDDAANFRNYKPKFDQSQADEIARRNVSYGGYTPGGTYGSDLAKKAGGFDKLSDKQKRDIYQNSLLSQPSFASGKKGIGDYSDNPLSDPSLTLNQKSLISKLASEQLALANPDENKSLQEKLQKQLDIVNKFKLGAATQEQVDAANRRIVSLTSVDPSKLNDRERSQAAVAREAMADRQDKFQQEAMALDKEKLKSEKALTEEIKKLREVAEKDGIKSIENLVTIKDGTAGGVDIEKKPATKPSPTAKTTRDHYNDYQSALD